jgi:Putative zinc-finger
MDHNQAARLMMAEKYLLNELPPEMRDEFEEHYFNCQECTADLQATAAFLDAAKKEFEAAPVPRALKTAVRKHPFEFLWRPAFALPAFALLLLVIVYQNAVVFPHLATQIAQLKTPELLPTLSLVGGNSRGGETPSISIDKTRPFLISVDIPTQDRFSSYTCLLHPPSGSTAFRIQVSAQQAKDTVLIHVPADNRATGNYTLVVQGNTDRVPAEPAVDLAHYPFVVKSQN